MTVTMTDLFCGAGGSSTGAIQIPGLSVIMAANHSKHAIDTHQANHPETMHDCADISQVVPSRYPKTDILWASPECTNYSGAKGVKQDHGDWNDGLFAPDGTDEAAIRSRATMWDVPRFAEAHQYRIIIVENVVENRWWGPKARPGAIYESWLHTMKHGLGYLHRPAYLNSMFAQALGDGAAQNRDRKYDVFWLEGERAPDFDKWLRPSAHCDKHGWIRAIQAWKTTEKCSPERPWGRYGARRQYVWRCPRVECRNAIVEPTVRPAADIIDWSRPAVAIEERADCGLSPLKPATMRRISAGFEEFAKPYLVPVEGREGKKPLSIDRPMRTCSTRNETGLAVPPYMVELRGGSSSHRSVSEPLATVCAGGFHHGIAAPDMVLPYYSNAKARPADAPLPTVTTIERHAALYGARVERIGQMRFRMFADDEYRAAMEFPEGYIFTPRDSRTRVQLIGNAVTPPAARDLIGMAKESITGEDIEIAA